MVTTLTWHLDRLWKLGNICGGDSLHHYFTTAILALADFYVVFVCAQFVLIWSVPFWLHSLLYSAEQLLLPSISRGFFCYYCKSIAIVCWFLWPTLSGAAMTSFIGAEAWGLGVSRHLKGFSARNVNGWRKGTETCFVWPINRFFWCTFDTMHIYCWVYWWKNFGSWTTFAQVTDRSAPYGLQCGNVPWFICWFRCYINCFLVCLFTYLPSLLPSFLIRLSLCFPREWLGKTSPKWPIFVLGETKPQLNESVNQSIWAGVKWHLLSQWPVDCFLCVILYNQGYFGLYRLWSF